MPTPQTFLSWLTRRKARCGCLGILLSPFALLSLLAVLTTAGVGGSSYMRRSSSCASCHEMQSSYVAWQHSTHFKPDGTRTAECVDCHVAPGVRGLLESKMQAVHDLYYHLTRDTSSEAWAQGREGRLARSRSKITNEICMRCHNPETTAPDALVVDHAKIDEETRCLECHSNLMRGLQVKNRFAVLPVRVDETSGSNEP